MSLNEVSVPELVALRSRENLSAIVIVGIENCEPCSRLDGAIELIERTVNLPVVKSVAHLAQKKEIGDLAKVGITQFPHIEIYVGGSRLFRSAGVRGRTSLEVSEEIVSQWLRIDPQV